MLLRCRMILVVFLSLMLFVPMGIPAAPAGEEILVSAAVSLKEAFVEIASIYEKQTGNRVRFNFGSSGLLQKQIEAGAPVDVFASAGEKQMNDLQTQGLIVTATRHDFAGNALVLIRPTDSKVSLKSFGDLSRPDIGRIAIGSPKTVPAGQYAEEALRNLKLWNAIQSRLVFAENVRQVLDYTARGEVDAGILYASDMAGERGDATVVAQAPEGSYSPIRYPISVMKQTGKEKDSRRFIELVLSGTGQNILKKYGFLGTK
jgi:molybdate transport system substrate-binding protein